MYPPAQNPPTAPSARNRRLVLILVIAGVLALFASGGALFVTGLLSGSDQGGLDDTNAEESERARPDEPSVNPDDTHYEVVAGLCEKLDLSEFEAMIPAKDKVEETYTQDPYGVEASEVECEQYLEDGSGEDFRFATVTVKTMSFTSVVEARLKGYGDYASAKLDDLDEVEPQWIEGEWEQAQLAEGIATADVESVLVGQDDNLAFLVTVTGGNGEIEKQTTTDAILAMAGDVLELCEK